MNRHLSGSLATWIAQGFRYIGEISITPLSEGRYELRHREDSTVENLTLFTRVTDARPLSFFTSAGEYRPLKTAPSLQRGWRLELASVDDLRIALDYFYPAMTGVWLSHLEGNLTPVALRDTLNRQTGMYAATKRLQDGEGQQLVAETCQSRSGCLKRKLWPFDAATPLQLLPLEERSAEVRPVSREGDFREIPLLCHEACNILVAACREVVKSRERAAQAASAEALAQSHAVVNPMGTTAE
jgi:sirohydrochlorin cobaltochelatase